MEVALRVISVKNQRRRHQEKRWQGVSYVSCFYDGTNNRTGLCMLLPTPVFQYQGTRYLEPWRYRKWYLRLPVPRAWYLVPGARLHSSTYRYWYIPVPGTSTRYQLRYWYGWHASGKSMSREVMTYVSGCVLLAGRKIRTKSCVQHKTTSSMGQAKPNTGGAYSVHGTYRYAQDNR